MGKNPSFPRIIEFNGLPGSGKTTIALILKELIEDRINTQALREYYRYSFQANPYSMFLSPSYYFTISKVRYYSKFFKDNRSLPVDLNVTKYLRMYKQFISDYNDGILVIDEGIVQMLISVAYDQLISNMNPLSQVISSLQLNKLPILFVNCNLDEESTAYRIKNRLPNGCRLENLSNEKMQSTLITQSNNFDVLRSQLFHCYTDMLSLDIYTSVKPENNAALVLDFLQSRYANEV